MDCTSARYKDSSLHSTSELANEIFSMRQSVKDMGFTLDHLHRGMEGLTSHSSSCQSMLKAIDQHLQQQQLAFASLHQTVAQSFQAVLSPQSQSARSTASNGKEIDDLMAMRLQPLMLQLDSIDRRISQSAPQLPSAEFAASSPSRPDALFKRLEQGFSDMRVQHEVTTFVSSGGHHVGQEGALSNAKPEGLPQISDFRVELKKFHASLLEDLKLKEQLQGFQESLLVDLKQQHEASVLGLQDLTIRKVEDLLNEKHVRKTAGSPVPLPGLIGKSVSPMESPRPDSIAVEQDQLRGGASAENLVPLRPNDSPPVMANNSSLTAPGFIYSDVEVQEQFLDEDASLPLVELHEDESLAAVFLNDEDVESPPYRVEHYYKTSGCAQAIARSREFANMTMVVVCFNAVWIGIDADWNKESNLYEADPVFQIFAQFFVIYFTFEWGVRLLAFKKLSYAMKDGWFKFDTFLVTAMVLDTWGLMVAMKFVMESSKGKPGIPTQPLRVLRLLKLTRMARLMRAFPELVTMVKGLFRSLRAITSSLILVLLMVYIWAILLNLTLRDEDDLNDKLDKAVDLNFRTLFNCMWCLVVCGTLQLDGATKVMTELLYYNKASVVGSGILFTLFSLLSALCILQMLIGVLCDVVKRVNDEQRDAVAVGLVKQELLAKLRSVDDGDGKISQAELFRIMNEDNCKAVLKKLGINRLFLHQLASMMFTSAKSLVTIKDALELMILCRSANVATVETIAGGFQLVVKQVNRLHHHLSERLSGLSRTPSTTI